MTETVKDIGHRQMYDILQGRKPRATGGDLWVFRVWPRCEARTTLVGMPNSGRQDGLHGLYSASMLAGAEA